MDPEPTSEFRCTLAKEEEEADLAEAEEALTALKDGFLVLEIAFVLVFLVLVERVSTSW